MKAVADVTFIEKSSSRTRNYLTLLYSRLKDPLAKAHQYRWKVGPWQKCSKDCGRGTQVRAVACFDSHRDARVAPFLCRVKVVKPKNHRQCNVHRCTDGKWIEGEWSACSVSCGKVSLALTRNPLHP